MKGDTMAGLDGLKGRRFSVYCGGEFERMTGYAGVNDLLVNWSDVPHYTLAERRQAVREWIKQGYVYVDCNISAKISR